MRCGYLYFSVFNKVQSLDNQSILLWHTNPEIRIHHCTRIELILTKLPENSISWLPTVCFALPNKPRKSTYFIFSKNTTVILIRTHHVASPEHGDSLRPKLAFFLNVPKSWWRLIFEFDTFPLVWTICMTWAWLIWVFDNRVRLNWRNFFWNTCAAYTMSMLRNIYTYLFWYQKDIPHINSITGPFLPIQPLKSTDFISTFLVTFLLCVTSGETVAWSSPKMFYQFVTLISDTSCTTMLIFVTCNIIDCQIITITIP